MKHNLQCILLLFFLFSCSTSKQISNKKNTQALIFSTGQKISNGNFTGTAYLQTLITADSSNPTAVGNVTFEPGARSKWHSHPAGQILLAISGVGFYQEQGQPKRILRKGDAVKCPANTPHWHGASKDSSFVQLAVTNNNKGPVVWLQTVTDEEYNQ
jgi:quercetin dioxygenase-like cupin family protein